ncbi:hypothetical protein FRC06_009796 [Ceratobasidium sp. 370]|nr:hypothetical protein FRC06_009796 [Ceratobasidium sp. 370]
MTRTNLIKKASASRHKAAGSKRPKGLAKRVEFGARENLGRIEFGMLMELWVKSNGKPRAEDRNELAGRLGRCPKQISVWFSNRRQNIRDAEVVNGARFNTEEDKHRFLWTKYRAPASEKHEASESASTSGFTSTDSIFELSRASSADVSECSIPEAATPAEDGDVEMTPCVAPFDFLLQAANLFHAEEKQKLEACEALLALGRS